jgi:nitrate/nitrite transporter NarK
MVDWSAAQTALATAEAGAVAGLVAALVAHFKPGTAKEPVALAATFTATVSATLALGSAFAWWSLTEQEMSAVAAVVTGILGVGGAVFARQRVTAGSSSATE